MSANAYRETLTSFKPTPYRCLETVSVEDRLKFCNVCGSEPEAIVATYTGGTPYNYGIVFVGAEHEGCLAKAEEFGYRPMAGLPGCFPLVCRDCKHRGFRKEGPGRIVFTRDSDRVFCTNPNSREYGGEGLRAKRDGLAVVSCSGRAA